jgi:hypothetical protein
MLKWCLGDVIRLTRSGTSSATFQIEEMDKICLADLNGFV